MAESSSLRLWSLQSRSSGTVIPCGHPYCVGRLGCALTHDEVAIDEKYRHLSLEELRLRDYEAGRYGRKFSTYAVANLSTIHVKPTQSLQQSRFEPDTAAALGGAIVTFRIGRKASKDFVVYEGSIAPGSEFVRLALRGDWKEVKERIIPLPEDDPEVFAVYQQWLYHGRICTSTTDFEPGTMDEYELLVHAYILGDKFVDVGFKDCVTDAILKKLLKQTHFSLRLTDEVFDNTLSHSPLRRLWMDIYYWTGCADWLDEDTVGQPINLDFMAEFSRFQMRQRERQSSCPITTPCNYHQHRAGECHLKSKEW